MSDASVVYRTMKRPSWIAGIIKVSFMGLGKELGSVGGCCPILFVKHLAVAMMKPDGIR